MRLKTIKEDTAASAPSKMKNFTVRTLSSVVLAPVCLYLLWKGGLYASALILLITSLIFFEWTRVCLSSPFTPWKKLGWFVAGCVYVGIALGGFLSLISLSGGGKMVMAYVLLALASDTGGYLFGISLRGPKLAPRISPSKTWSGSVGALVLTWIVAHGILMAMANLGLTDLWMSGIIAIPLSLITQGGDLLESWMKRRFHIKDTGHIIPGHGGVLDRVDGVLAIGVGLFIIQLLRGEPLSFPWW